MGQLRKKSIVQMRKIECQESLKPTESVDIEDIDITTNDSHRNRFVSEENKCQTHKTFVTFGNNHNVLERLNTQDNHPISQNYYKRGSAQQQTSLRPPRQKPNYIPLEQIDDSINQTTNQILYDMNNQVFQTSQVQMTRNKSNSQLLNSVSVCSNSFMSEDGNGHPIDTIEKQVVLATFKKNGLIPNQRQSNVYRIINANIQNHSQDYNSEDRTERILAKKELNYPNPLNNTSQQFLSQLSNSQEYSLQESEAKNEDQDEFLDQSLLDQQNQIEEGFQYNGLEGDNDDHPQSFSIQSSTSSRQEQIEECEDYQQIQNMNNHSISQSQDDQNDLSHCSIIQAESLVINKQQSYSKSIIQQNPEISPLKTLQGHFDSLSPSKSAFDLMSDTRQEGTLQKYYQNPLIETQQVSSEQSRAIQMRQEEEDQLENLYKNFCRDSSLGLIEKTSQKEELQNNKQSTQQNFEKSSFFNIKSQQVEKQYQQISISIIEKHSINNQKPFILNKVATPQYLLSPNKKQIQLEQILKQRRSNSAQIRQTKISEQLQNDLTGTFILSKIKKQTSQAVLKWSSQEEKERYLVQLNNCVIQRSLESLKSPTYREDYYENECLPKSKPYLTNQPHCPLPHQDLANTYDQIDQSSQNSDSCDVQIIDSKDQVIKMVQVKQSDYVESVDLPNQNLDDLNLSIEPLQTVIIEEAAEISMHLAKEGQSSLSHSFNQESRGSLLNLSQSKCRYQKLAQGLKHIQMNQVDQSIYTVAEEKVIEIQEEEFQADDMLNSQEEEKTFFEREQLDTPSPRVFDLSVITSTPIPVLSAPLITQDSQSNHNYNQESISVVEESKNMDMPLQNSSSRQNTRSRRNKIKEAHQVLSQYSSSNSKQSSSQQQLEFPNNFQLKEQYDSLMTQFKTHSDQVTSNEEVVQAYHPLQISNEPLKLPVQRPRQLMLSAHSSEESVIISAPQQYEGYQVRKQSQASKFKKVESYIEMKNQSSPQTQTYYSMSTPNQISSKKQSQIFTNEINSSKQKSASQDKHTKEMFKRLFKGQQNDMVIDEQPSQEEAESSINQDARMSLEFQTKKEGKNNGSKSSSQISLNNIDIKDSEIFSANAEPQTPFNLNIHSMKTDFQVQSAQQMSKSNSFKNLSLSPQRVIKSSRYKNHAFDAMQSPSKSQKSQASQHESQSDLQPQPYIVNQYSTLQPLDTPSKDISNSSSNSQQKPPLSSQKKRLINQEPSNKNISPTPEAEDLKNVEKNRTMSVKERRELIQRQKMEKLASKLERKMNKIETIQEQNFFHIQGNESQRNLNRQSISTSKIQSLTKDSLNTQNLSRSFINDASFGQPDSPLRNKYTSAVVDPIPEQPVRVMANYHKRRINSNQVVVPDTTAQNQINDASNTERSHKVQTQYKRVQRDRVQSFNSARKVSTVNQQQNSSKDLSQNSSNTHSAQQSAVSFGKDDTNQNKSQTKLRSARVKNQSSESINMNQKQKGILNLKGQTPTSQQKKAFRFILKTSNNLEDDKNQNFVTPQNSNKKPFNLFFNDSHLKQDASNQKTNQSMTALRKDIFQTVNSERKLLDSQSQSEQKIISNLMTTRQNEFMKRVTEDHKRRLSVRARIVQ